VKAIKEAVCRENGKVQQCRKMTGSDLIKGPQGGKEGGQFRSARGFQERFYQAEKKKTG